MRVGVLGGTFDPIHTAHLILGEAAREGLGLDRVIFVPAGDPWRKAGRKLASVEDRVAMVQLAAADNPYFALSTVEAERAGASYTDETLAVLKESLNEDSELFFILGRDTLYDLPYWKDPQRIIAQAWLAIAERPGVALSPDAELERAVPGITARLAPFTMPALEISSTDIRLRRREGRSIRYLVPAAVEEYILRHSLYKDG
jgi:nicotinate-nucleotide adenylyltransferase